MRCLALIASLLFTAVLHAQSLNIGTYNLRYANAGDSARGNGWGQRLPAIAGIVQFNDWDIFGTQEVSTTRWRICKAACPGMPMLAWVGMMEKKRVNTLPSGTKKDKFKLLQSHTFWLSTDTTKPNTAWDAALPRICTWGRFQDRQTGFVFYFFNLHMDHIGVVARRESAKLVLQKIQALKGNIPVILTGDFNVDQTSESYTLINTSGILCDAYELSPLKLANNGTFNNFSTVEKTDSRIDHIFLSKDFMANRYAILTNMYWNAPVATDTMYANHNQLQAVPRLPSDHYPVMVKVAYKLAARKKQGM